MFADDRAGQHDVPQPVTDTDVYIVTSSDGVSWSAPVAVAAGPGDQWFPWVDANPALGGVGILFNQRSTVDPHLYDISLATGSPGSFSLATVSTASSNPYQAAFFRAHTASCWLCTRFHGDYICIAYGSDGAANMVWTDMRRLVHAGPNPAYTENIFFARSLSVAVRRPG